MNSATPCVNVNSAQCVNNDGAGLPRASGVPLSMAKVGEKGVIVSISGKEEVRKFLSDLGFTIGTEIKAVCQSGGNIIIDVKGSKIAIDKHMANKIQFCPSS